MTNGNGKSLWLKDDEVARILRLNPGTIRNWRTQDAREGRGGPDNPGRGGLVWRRFGRAVRYLATPQLLGQVEAGDVERR